MKTHSKKIKYIALLRGIGPSNPNMHNEKLAGVFKACGFEKVQTVISSGNVLFESSPREVKTLESVIKKALTEQLGFSSTVIIRRQAEIQSLINADPFKGIEDTPRSRLNTTFLKNPPEIKLKFPYQLRTELTCS